MDSPGALVTAAAGPYCAHRRASLLMLVGLGPALARAGTPAPPPGGAFALDRADSALRAAMRQAYALRDGLYKCPPWMQVKAREINDPFALVPDGRHGALNVTDLYNLHTCAFIETSDLGKVYADGRFEVLGRIDHSDVRGCNLLL